MLRELLVGLIRAGKNLEVIAGSSRGGRLHACRWEGTCPPSWRVSADYYTFKTF